MAYPYDELENGQPWSADCACESASIPSRREGDMRPILTLAFVACACGSGQNLSQPANTGTEHTTGGGPETVCTGSPTVQQAQEACAAPDGAHLAIATLDEFKAAITGSWYRCLDAGVVSRAHDGLFIDSASYALIEFRAGEAYTR